MEKAAELFAAICFLVIGLSHMAQPRAWVDLFIRLREKGHSGVFIVAFMSLPFGAFIVAFHNVWTGLPILLTLVGWAQVIKGGTYFIVPQLGLKALATVAPQRAWTIVVGGFVFLCLSGVLWYVVLFQR